jgi:hypothetical protein
MTCKISVWPKYVLYIFLSILFLFSPFCRQYLQSLTPHNYSYTIWTALAFWFMPGAKPQPIWQGPVALAPLNDMLIYQPSFNLMLRISDGLINFVFFVALYIQALHTFLLLML